MSAGPCSASCTSCAARSRIRWIGFIRDGSCASAARSANGARASHAALEPIPFRLNRNGTPDSCFDAFSSREPVSTPHQVRGRLRSKTL
ncbi:hypothetical protein XH92_10840 [Bradyrhizobium sp. CCBAU 53421]|nr:hypothetical protein XH92_10840 [Bradyrhizobium sp. CCBAU 53421]